MNGTDVFTCTTPDCWLCGSLWAIKRDCPECGQAFKPIQLSPILTYGDFLHLEEYSNGEDEKTLDAHVRAQN